MKVVLLTPGTGSDYCGVCMRDNALAREVIRMGHEALMIPMYLPLTLDETAASAKAPIFFGGINVYLQQKFPLFRNTPRWLDRLLDYRGLLKIAGKMSGMTGGAEIGALTLSMLKGEQGNQAKELNELVEWLKSHLKPDAIWISTALLEGLARRLSQELRIPILCSLQGEDVFLDDLPELRIDLATIWAVVVEPFDDADVTVDIARRRNFRIAQHQGFRQNLVIPGKDRTRQRGRTEQRRADADQTERFAAAAFRMVPGEIVGSVHFSGSREGWPAPYTIRARTCYAPAYRVPPQ